MDAPADETALRSDAATTRLLDNHRAFLAYLERRVGDRALAEDILQDAFVRTAGKLDEVPEEALVPWFYRTLRNAAIDHWRREGVRARALDAFARELDDAGPDRELEREICACVLRLAGDLKPEYADALQAVDVDGMAVSAFAAREGVTATNASVRLHRARKALKARVAQSCGTCAEHGCLDCTCGSRSGSAGHPL